GYYPDDIAVTVDHHRHPVFIVCGNFQRDEKVAQLLAPPHPQRVEGIARLPRADSERKNESIGIELGYTGISAHHRIGRPTRFEATLAPANRFVGFMDGCHVVCKWFTPPHDHGLAVEVQHMRRRKKLLAGYTVQDRKSTRLN